ncbi:MAG: MFS transporter [Anaerolineales bacterium]|nr:MFS transporter [Anaerolineales bacterium]
MKKPGAYQVYLFLEGASALLYSMIFAASSVYQVTVAGLSPLQLVLVGTTLETAVFLFEIPTGVVADVYSRKLSIIIGLILVGGGFILEGSIPIFWTILLAQILWGLGYTFTSGATQAWISDEIGEQEANRAFLRANQVGNIAGLVGLAAGMTLGSFQINIPIQLGGGLLVGLGLFLIWSMPESGFQPIPREDRSSWQNLVHTFRLGIQTVRSRPALLNILSVGLIYGLYSEGFDRLWTKHLLDNFILPTAFNLQPVFWIGLMRVAGLLLAVGFTEIARRKINTGSFTAIARALFFLSVLLIAGLFSFALAGSLAFAVLAYWLISITRDLIGPIYTAWVNQRLEPGVRATVISMSSQVDAIGQIAGGPVLGVIGSAVSVRAALVASSAILSPILILYRRAIHSPAVHSNNEIKEQHL